MFRFLFHFSLGHLSCVDISVWCHLSFDDISFLVTFQFLLQLSLGDISVLVAINFGQISVFVRLPF